VLIIASGQTGEQITELIRRAEGAPATTLVPTPLAAIAALGDAAAAGVVALIDARWPHLPEAIRGLREAAPAPARIILCAPPEMEPAARLLLEAGADDYVILPPEPDDLLQSLRLSPAARWEGRRLLTAEPTPPADELAMLAELLSLLDARPIELLERTAILVRRTLSAAGVTVVVSGSVATSGEVVTEPVLAATVDAGADRRGQVLVGPPAGSPYQPVHVRRLEHYARIAGYVLAAVFDRMRWRQQAETDELSGLPNRRHFDRALLETLEQGRANRMPVTLLLFDIDDFKSYNDRYGHDAGDEIIRTAAALFRANCREHDLVARYGGDEFAVVFWDPKGQRVAGSRPPADAMEVLERFRRALRSHEFRSFSRTQKGQLTISGGLATYPWDADTPEALVKRADDALLEAKRAGKDRIYLIGESGSGKNSATG